MKYEVIETDDEWVVQAEGVEEARYEQQEDALNHVAARLKDADPGDDGVSLCVRYQPREA